MEITEDDVLEQLKEIQRQKADAQALLYRLDGGEQICTHQLLKIHERKTKEREQAVEHNRLAGILNDCAAAPNGDAPVTD